MSTIINATTTNGVVIQPDNSGSLALQTNNGTTALTIDTSQNATFAGTLTATGKLASSSMPTGSIVQVIYASTTTAFTTASATYVATPLTATITKSFSTSKILILASPNVQAYSSGANAKVGGMMYDTTNSRQIIDFNCVNRDYVGSGGIHVSSPNLSLQAYDTNSGTGSRQYTFYIKNIEGTDARLNIDTNGEATSTMVLMEVVG